MPGHSTKITVDEEDTLYITGKYGITYKISTTPVGELEIELCRGGTLTVVSLSRSVALLLPMPVSSRQQD